MCNQISQISAAQNNYESSFYEGSSVADIYSQIQVGNINSYNTNTALIGNLSFISGGTTTDHGAVQAGIQTAQIAVTATKEVAIAALTFNEENTRLVLENSQITLQKTLEAQERHFKKIYNDCHRRELEANDMIWAMLPNLSRDALLDLSKQMRNNIEKSLISIEEAEVKERAEESEKARREIIIGYSRTQKLNLAKERIAQIFSELNNKAIEAQKPSKAYFIVPILLLPSDAKIAMALVVISALFFIYNTDAKLNSIESQKQLVTTYKATLEILQTNPDLTIREAFRLQNQSSDYTTLLKLPNVPVKGDENNEPVKITPELENFVAAARKSAHLLN